MSVMTVRGGIPYVVRDTDVTTGGHIIRLPCLILHLKVRNVGAVPCRIFFTEADYTANARYVVVPVVATSTPYGEWEGPVETASGDHSDIWVRGDGGTGSLEIVAFQRRG